MRRREFIALLGGAVVARPVAVWAQRTATPLIGYLSSGSLESDTVRLTGLRRGLNEAGFVEGRNVTIAYRWAGEQFDRLPALAADLVEHGVAVIVTPGPIATLAAKAATTTVPIVFLVGIDPVQLGLVASLNRPGGNLTGVNSLGSEVSAKRLEILRELMPTTAVVGFLVNPSNPITELALKNVLATARAIGVEIQILHASTEAGIDAAFASLALSRTRALFVSGDIFFNSRITQVVALAARHAVPMVYPVREFPIAGGLMSYGINLTEAYRFTGLQLARILKGEKPADLPVIQITKIELVINLNAAKVLGLSVPPSLLARADEIIE